MTLLMLIMMYFISHSLQNRIRKKSVVDDDVQECFFTSHFNSLVNKFSLHLLDAVFSVRAAKSFRKHIKASNAQLKASIVSI